MPQERTSRTENADRRRERLILFILAAVQFITIVDFMIVMPLGPQFMRTLEIGTAEFSLIVSSYTFAAGIAGLVASSIVDRYARRTTFMLLYAGFLIGTLFCAIAPNYELLIAARIATGAFGGILGGLSMTIVGDVFPDERRGRATGLLMSGFALASVAGVPLGLYLGTNFGWHIPFIALVVVGLPFLLLTPSVMPKLDGHLGRVHAHPLRSLAEMFTVAGHLRAFALTVALMIGSFSVFPYVSAYFVGNVGLTEDELPFLYIVGGALTLGAAPLVGRLADRFGKLRVYRIVAPLTAVMMLVITMLPPVPAWVAVIVFGLLMVSNIGRSIPAMAMITGSVEPRLRGGFMSANSAIQHIAAGVATSLGGLIITKSVDGRIERFGAVGLTAAAASLATLWLAGRLRSGEIKPVAAAEISLAAAAEATVDDGEAMVAAVAVDETRR